MLSASANVDEAVARFLGRVREHLGSFLEPSDDFREPYFVRPKTFLLPSHPGAWVVAQYNTPRIVNFIFRPLSALRSREVSPPVDLEYVDEPLSGFRVPAYVIVTVRKKTLLDGVDAESAFEQLKALAEVAFRELSRSPELYAASFTDSADLIRRAQASGDSAALFGCALNPHCPSDVLTQLASSRDSMVLRAVACHGRLSPEQQLGLASNPHLDYRASCALASRFDLEPAARARLAQCPAPAVRSYLTGPRVVEYLEQDGASSYLPRVSAFFRHLLGDEYLKGVAKRNAGYFDYFARHRQMDFEELLTALDREQLAAKGLRQILSRVLSASIDRESLARAALRLADSAENTRRLRELRIKPFSFLIQYEHVWMLKGRREDVNFNLALEYAPRLYYPRQISTAAIDEAFAPLFIHLRNNICWCSGSVGAHEGKTALFILGLQSDFFRLSQPHLRGYFRSWSQLLLNVVVVEAQRRGVEVVYMIPSEALRVLYGEQYGITYQEGDLAAWREIYDENAARLGMRLERLPRAVNIFPNNWARFEWDEFYVAEVGELAGVELVDSSLTVGKRPL
jgi:hypothetical protein